MKFQDGSVEYQLSRTAINNVLENTQRTRTTISQYTSNLAQIRQQRNTLLNIQGGQLKSQADAIAGAALDHLTSATNELERQGEQTQQLTILALILTLLVTAIFSWLLPRTMTKPLLQLVDATKRLNQGDYGVVVTTRDGSEIGQLAASFNQMSTALSHEREQVLRQQGALTKQNQELEHTLAELQAATAAREQLAVAVRTLSVPVLPILEQVLLIPLVGEIDTERAQILLERLLDGITTGRARIAIIDITGVPLVDESLVDWLMRATSAARLMGARCILVGIGPEVAQALVASGADLADLTTRSDLRSAVEYAVRGNRLTSTACAVTKASIQADHIARGNVIHRPHAGIERAPLAKRLKQPIRRHAGVAGTVEEGKEGEETAQLGQQRRGQQPTDRQQRPWDRHDPDPPASHAARSAHRHHGSSNLPARLPAQSHRAPSG